jgi:hypothetical protein
MGTWALPQTIDQAKQLSVLLQQPLLARDAPQRLYGLLGDDALFDAIASEREHLGDAADVCQLVKGYLAQFLKHADLALKPWEAEAHRLLSDLCRSS